MDLSVVLPVYNEEGNIALLYEKLNKVLMGLSKKYEIIMVNDGSKDATSTVLKQLAEKDSCVKVIEFRRNFGQTAAVTCGVDNSTGKVVVIMDSDLQNDPIDIPRLLEKLEEGYDVVSGFRVKRKDGIVRKIFSRIANMLVRKVSGVNIVDLGCSLKAYKRDVLKDVKLYGEMHRFLPIYVYWVGGNVTNIPVSHSPRYTGKSNYGFSRIYKVVVDLFVIKFLGYYATKPMYFFGKMAGFSFFTSVITFILYLSNIFSLTQKFKYYLPVSVILFMGTLLFICFGILSEMMVRIYHETQNKPTYFIKNKMNL